MVPARRLFASRTRSRSEGRVRSGAPSPTSPAEHGPQSARRFAARGGVVSSMRKTYSSQGHSRPQASQAPWHLRMTAARAPALTRSRISPERTFDQHQFSGVRPLRLELWLRPQAVQENRLRAMGPIVLWLQNPSLSRTISAVVGCHRATRWAPAHEIEPERTSADDRKRVEDRGPVIHRGPGSGWRGCSPSHRDHGLRAEDCPAELELAGKRLWVIRKSPPRQANLPATVNLSLATGYRGLGGRSQSDWNRFSRTQSL